MARRRIARVHPRGIPNWLTLSNSKAEIKRPDTWTVMSCKSFLASLRMLVAQREPFLTGRVSMGYEAREQPS
jgi:hypothetical protein